MGCHDKAAKLACKRGLPAIHYRVGNVTEPDYTVQDHDPMIVDRHKLIIEPSSPRWAEVRIANMEYYRLIGNVDDFEQGDIIEVDTSKVRSTLPPVTILQNTEGHACLGFKTDRIGAVYSGNQVDANLLYENIKFCFLPSSDYAGRALNRELKESIDVPAIEIVTFQKIMWTENRDAEGLTLIETDRDVQMRWIIHNVIEHGVVQIWTLKRDW